VAEDEAVPPAEVPAETPPPVDTEMVTAPAHFDGPPPAPREPPVQLRPSQFADVVPQGGTWAVLIGINDYPGTAYDLHSAVADANDVDGALAGLGVTRDRRLVLRDGQAGAGTIRAAVDWLTSHAGPDATAVFFFAGHIRKVGDDREALVGSDGGNVTDVELAAMLDRLQAAKTWIALAGCYSGGFTEVVKPGRVLTAAAPADRPAYENASFGRSYLVEYMVRRAMLGDGASTVEGAFAEAQAGLQRDYPDRVPLEFDALPGDLDLRVPPPAKTAPAPAPAPVPSSGGTSTSSSPPSPPPPDPNDGCANLTAGIVRCTHD
jgi:hypothetical protein